MKHTQADTHAMYRSLLLLAIASAVGCRPSPSSSAPAQPQPVATIDEAPAPTPTEEPKDAALQRSCEGERLDLAWLEVRSECFEKDSKPDQPAVRLEPPSLTVASGQRLWFDLVFANDSDAAGQFGVFSCDIRNARATITKDGERVDLLAVCGRGGGCGGPVRSLTLEPHGSARLPLYIDAQQVQEQDDCSPSPPSPLEPGRYEVTVEMPSGSVSAPFEITP